MITAEWTAPGTLEVTGHAGTAPAGADLVCAGVTTLCYALARTIAALEHRGRLMEKPRLHLEPGRATLTARSLPEAETYLTGAFAVALEGLTLLAEQYPGAVKMINKGANNEKT